MPNPSQFAESYSKRVRGTRRVSRERNEKLDAMEWCDLR